MDDNKTGMQVANIKVESSSESRSPEKCTESEDSDCKVHLKSPPLNNEGDKETKTTKKAFVRVLSFRRGISKSFKEKSTKEPEILRSSEQFAKGSFKQTEDCVHANKGYSSDPEESGEFKDDRIEKEPSSEHQKSSSGSEDGDCEAPPLNNEADEETTNTKKAFVRLLSFRRGISNSFRSSVSTKEPEILRSSEQFAKRSFKQTEDGVHANKRYSGDPQESGEFKDDSIKKEAPSGEKETTSPTEPLTTVLPFSRGISQSFREKSMKEPGILRSSKRFARRSFEWIEGHVHARKECRSIPEENRKPEDKCSKQEPLSVMEINELIRARQLLEAFENIKGLEMELLAKRDAKKYEDNPKEYTVMAKDVDLLYGHISTVIQQIVQEMLDLPGIDEKALTSLVTLIEEEDKAHPEASKASISVGPAALGSARNWRQLWKEAVNQSAKGRVCKVPVPSKDHNPSWLSVHLEHLRMAVKEDLLKVKLHVQKCYPQDYNVCNTYVWAFHDALSVRIHDILEDNRLTLSEFYALLNWITNTYHSEEFLGHLDLKPEIKTEDLPSLLSPEALDKLKNDYVYSVKEMTKIYLDNILVLQTEKKWELEEQPEALQSQLCSPLSLDIQTIVGEHMKASGSISDSLEAAVLQVSLKEVTEFMPRFQKAFLEWDKENNHPQFVELMVTYINDFQDLLRGLERNFHVSCQELEKALGDVMLNYRKYFFHKLRQKTQPMFKKILSKQWMLHNGTPDSFILKVVSVTDEFSKPLIHLKEPIYKDFLHEIHKYMVKEYITQTLKRSKTGRRKCEEVSKRMKQDASIINNSMKDLGSSSDWLFPAILHIADIIGEKKKRKIKDCLKNLCQDYPDIRREHILALLALRGLWRNSRQLMADQIDGLSGGLESGSNRTLFAEIELPNTIRCF